MEEFCDNYSLSAEMFEDEDELEKEFLSSENYSAPTIEYKATVVEKPRKSHIDVLKTYFGHTNFRPMQWKIIHSIIEDKRDNCVIMATGYGKSLCYQYPAVYCEGLTIVVSPLISLMEDQVLSLQVANISACMLGSAQTSKKKVEEGIFMGKHRVVYLTPELCTGDYGQELLQDIANKRSITLVAIDEAHCVSQWGHDFRSSYRKLSTLRKLLPNVPFLAVTATATPEVRQDICSSLQLRNPIVTCTGFDRPNLYLAVNAKGPSIFDDLRTHMVRDGNRLVFEGPTIIYCPTKKQTEKICEVLKANGLSCEYYNADVSLKLRKKTHEDFVKDRVQCIIATVAFGMGIDKPDVRCVIHYGAPKDIESYYQEVGRAGRDGLAARCHCYYSTADFSMNSYFLSNLRGEARAHREKMMRLMEQYLETAECRRSLLLSHFEGRDRSIDANRPLMQLCCDNCTRKFLARDKTGGREFLEANGTYDFGADAKLLLGAIDHFNGRVGLTVPIMFLRGSKNKKIKEEEYSHQLYGKGKHKPEAWWKGIGRLLHRNGYLQEGSACFSGGRGFKSFPVITTGLSQEGRALLSKFQKCSETVPLHLTPTPDLLEVLKQQRKFQSPAPVIVPVFAANAWIGSQKVADEVEDGTSSSEVVSIEEQTLQAELYKELIALRKTLANDNSCMPYMVASNKALMELSKMRPSRREHLTGVDGFMQAKINKFGTALIAKIRDFCNVQNLPRDVSSEENTDKRGDHSDGDMVAQLSETVRHSYILLQHKRKDLSTVALERGLALGTVTGHLCLAIKAGLPLDLELCGITYDVRDTILNAIQSPPVNSDTSSLTRIKENCPEYIAWDQLKIVVCLFTNQRLAKNHTMPVPSQKIQSEENSCNSVESKSVVLPDGGVSSQLCMSDKTDSSCGKSSLIKTRQKLQTFSLSGEREQDSGGGFGSETDPSSESTVHFQYEPDLASVLPSFNNPVLRCSNKVNERQNSEMDTTHSQQTLKEHSLMEDKALPSTSGSVSSPQTATVISRGFISNLASKRKLPDWLGSKSIDTNNMKRKMKNNTLFKM